ncbi:MAG: HesB/IscA family protein [Gammaproteobacteria bacterium]
MTNTGITLTERAATHIKDYLAKSGDGLGLRLGVKPSGCSGHQYVLEAAKAIGELDHAFESNGVKIVIDKQSLRYLAGTELDYVREGLNEGFRFHNPNVQETCGCGESFSLAEDSK